MQILTFMVVRQTELSVRGSVLVKVRVIVRVSAGVIVRISVGVCDIVHQ